MPDAAHEAMRDLVRARSAAVADLQRVRQRIAAFLLRQRIVDLKKPWTKTHCAWLGGLRFARVPEQSILMVRRSAPRGAEPRTTHGAGAN